VDFDLSHSFSFASGLVLDYHLTAPVQGLSIRIIGSAASGTTVDNVTLTVTLGENEAEITAAGGDAAVTGTVTFNGRTVATISGPGSNPVFTGQSGRVLTAADLAGLKGLFDYAIAVFEGFDDLLVPAYFVFGVGA
jgi:hypothetical protein